MDHNELISRLARLDACAVSDAMDHLKLRGVALGLAPVSVPRRIAGRVITIKLKSAGKKKPPRHLGATAIDSASPGDIIVVQHGRTNVSGWGGTLSLAAQKSGVAGVIVDGACRDIDEMRALNFPVYARCAVPLSARGRVVEESTNSKIRVAGVAVRPGDYVIADSSGVVFLPAAHAPRIIETAEKIVVREKDVAAALEAGRPASQALGAKFERILDP